LGKLPLSAVRQATEILIRTGNIEQQQLAAKYYLESPIQPRPIPFTHFEWLQSIGPGNELLQLALDSANLAPQIAESLKNFLHPNEPSYPGTLVNSSSQSAAGLRRPQKHRVTSPEVSKNDSGKGIHDPRPWIGYTAFFAGLVAILGTLAFACGKWFQIAKLSTGMSLAALTAVTTSILIAGGAALWFSKNKTVKWQWPLAIFCYFGLALMIVSAVAVLGSFVAPFLSGKVFPNV
jgi:hypothetical protein